MSLFLQIGILVLSIYLLAKGIELKVKGAKNPDTDSARNRWLALGLVVLGLAAGFAGLYWLGGMASIRQAFGR